MAGMTTLSLEHPASPLGTSTAMCANLFCMLKGEFLRAPWQCAALTQGPGDSDWKGPGSQFSVRDEWKDVLMRRPGSARTNAASRCADMGETGETTGCLAPLKVSSKCVW